MSMVKDALFNEEVRRKEMGTMSYSGMQALVGDGRAGLRKEPAGVPTVEYLVQRSHIYLLSFQPRGAHSVKLPSEQSTGWK